MSPREEAKELITQWVFEGKDLETVEKELAKTSLASALSPHDIELKYYAAGTARKVAGSGPPAKGLTQVIAILALLLGLTVVFFLPFIVGDDLAKAVGKVRSFGALAILLGLILLFNPARAFEKD